MDHGSLSDAGSDGRFRLAIMIGDVYCCQAELLVSNASAVEQMPCGWRAA